jgi:hypothetical protein
MFNSAVEQHAKEETEFAGETVLLATQVLQNGRFQRRYVEQSLKRAINNKSIVCLLAGD